MVIGENIALRAICYQCPMQCIVMHLFQVLTLSNILQTLIRLVIVLSGSPTIHCLKLTYSNHSNFLFNPLSDLEITEKGYNKLFERLVRFLQYIAIEKTWKQLQIFLSQGFSVLEFKPECDKYIQIYWPKYLFGHLLLSIFLYKYI